MGMVERHFEKGAPLSRSDRAGCGIGSLSMSSDAFFFVFE